ncbi:MAG TPA: TetR/AcrR family transcriptional regulator [Phenylobacterium sp.]
MSTVAIAPRRTTRKAKGDGHLRRAEILEAAERIFVADGYGGATIRKIADEVGVSSTALYMHFPDKACILHEIVEGTLSQLLARNTEIAGRPLDAVARTRMMLDAYMRWGMEHPNAYQLVYGPTEAVPDPAPERTSELSEQCYAAFSSAVREIAASGRLRVGSADSAAQALWMACHGVVALFISRREFEWVDIEELMQITLDGMLRGLVVD